jgi:hypothetical protein
MNATQQKQKPVTQKNDFEKSKSTRRKQGFAYGVL